MLQLSMTKVTMIPITMVDNADQPAPDQPWITNVKPTHSKRVMVQIGMDKRSLVLTPLNPTKRMRILVTMSNGVTEKLMVCVPTPSRD